MRFIDAHTHVQFAAFDADREAVVLRALEAGVWLVNVGTQKDTSVSAVELARKYKEGVYAAVGLHPAHTAKSFHDAQELGGGEAAKGFTSRGEEFDHTYYRDLASDSKVVAIGECGLDYAAFVRERSERSQKRASAEAGGGLTQEEIEQRKQKQRQAFEAQIRLAHELEKPLMIHCRGAFEDLIRLLSTNSKFLGPNPGIIHFFTGTLDDASKLLALGFSFTFGGAITFPPRLAEQGRGGNYDEVIRAIPMDRILSETDAPYVAPAPHRGKRNEPRYVIEVVRKLAELKQVSVQAMDEQIFENAKQVFRI
ncbi:MAG: hypothetical protein A2681_02075 [Candidatus Liptonbacteria bacterium RIFCSPHIGHO2_01_FULL_56_18b]|nr:MAG: Hydrolase, TatD family [Parcubacteria group bacterium GW2011_GWB1_56_8]OGY97739.1 MAG: hypothetical protein A2681_02075 [Candidatus Liptonbacteria bacterium RIFCSPHIGHO2_01_FULL_56_18b]